MAVVAAHKALKRMLTLTKPRILGVNLIATAVGFVFALKSAELGLAGGMMPTDRTVLVFLAALAGTGFVCGGAAAVNNYLEWEVDGRMLRTRSRPVPGGEIAPRVALGFGLALVTLGETFLLLAVGPIAAGLALVGFVVYDFVYTPLKQLSRLNTTVGAIPGAIPPLIGWSAVTGGLEPQAWIFFVLLFVWQHLHFFAIAWRCRDDYRRGGFKMVGDGDATGARLAAYTLVFLPLLMGVSFLPTVLGMAHIWYFLGAFGIGVAFGVIGVGFARSRTYQSARALLRASVLYLPAVLVILVFDWVV